MKKITHQQLVELLAARNGAQQIGLETVTVVLEKSPIGKILKRSKGSFCTGASYSNAVNRAMSESGKKGKFVSKGLPNGHFVIPNKVIENKGLKLRTQYRNGKRLNRNVKIEYLDENGEVMSPIVVGSFLPKSRENSRQPLPEEKQVHVRDYKFESIKKITINKKTYQVKS